MKTAAAEIASGGIIRRLLHKCKNENLEQQAQALYKSWFVDYDPYEGGVLLIGFLVPLMILLRK